MKNLPLHLFLFFFISGLIYADTLNVPGDYSSIQAAIDAASNGDLVLVVDGTYTENVDFKGKAITVASHFIVDDDSTHIENTIIDGSQPSNPDSGSVVYMDNCQDTTSVICGFTITGGTGNIYTQFNDRSGGGIALGGGTVRNNIIENNHIVHNDYTNGGGLFADLEGSPLIIENNVIRNNSITGNNWSAGGGMVVYDFSYSSYCRIVNNKIMYNTNTDPNNATSGGLEINGGSADYMIIGNFIKGNQVSGYGGGATLYDCEPTFRNNLIVGNSAPFGAGLVFEDVHNQIVTENNTIVNNTASTAGGGLRITGSTSPQLVNFIIWGNTATNSPQILGTPPVRYSNVEGGYTGLGNIDEDPQFIPNKEYFPMEETSPCVDAGNPDAQYNDVEDPMNPGNPWWPAQGTLRNDMGHCGGPSSLWHFWDWPMPVEETSPNVINFTLMQNYPNPFNPSTKIRYSIPQSSNVVLRVFDILGNEIATLAEGVKEVGSYTAEFNATNLTSGIYFYRLEADDFVETKKMILLK